MPGRLMADKDDHSGRPPSTATLTQQKPNGVIKTAPPPPPPNQNPARPQNETLIKREPSNGASIAPTTRQLPPELLEITTFSYPLRHLLDRNAQDCFAGLLELLDSIQDIPQHLNGVTTNQTAPELGEFDAARRRNWMQFAKYYRDRFIKILVLIRWLEGAQDFRQLYAIDEYLLRLLDASDNAIWSFQDMRDEITKIKIPSPDIETAVSVLAKGQIARIPSLNYIPPPALTDEKLLKTLRQMNMILHVRLNRDEDLPSYLRNFTIHSGRATFTIPNEFELDLSIASEDPATQLFFLDLRFLFTPNIEIPHFFLTQLDMRVNAKLAEAGVRAAFDMLHDFVLTHKINLLRRQAIDLNQRSWAGTLRIEQIHRSLVIQYWQDRPGKKSWLEIGVNIGEHSSADQLWKERPPPQLGVKWYRNGVLVPDAKIDLPLGNLRMATVLKSAIAQHISWILSSIAASGNGTLQAFSKESGGNTLELPMDAALVNRPITLAIETRSGRFSLQPWSKSAIYYEAQLNKLEKPEVDASGHLRSFQYSYMQDLVVERCQQDGLQQERDLDWPSQGPGERFSVFKVPQWTGGWRLVWTLSQGSQSWVALRTEYNMKTMKRRPTLRVDLQSGSIPATSTVSKFAEFAAQKISLVALLKAASDRGLHAQLYKNETSAPSVLVDVSSIVPGLKVRIDMRKNKTEGVKRQWDGPKAVTHVVRGRLSVSDTLKRMLRESPGQEIDVAESGQLEMVLEHELGSPSILEDALTRLRSVARLDSLLRSLQLRRIEPTLAALRAVEFPYVASEPQLKARVSFSLDDSSAHLSFSPRSNPHRRLTRILNRVLDKALGLSPSGTDVFSLTIDQLRNSLHGMRVLAKLERGSKGDGIQIMPTSMVSFRCAWRSGYAFDLSLKEYETGPSGWVIGRFTAPRAPPRIAPPEAFRRANSELKELLTRQDPGGRWKGVKNAMLTTMEGIEEPLQRIDSILGSLAAELQSSQERAVLAAAETSNAAADNKKAAGTAGAGHGSVAHRNTGHDAQKSGGAVPAVSKGEKRDVVVLD